MHHKLTLTTEQLAIIDRALSQQPYGIVAGLITEINRQLQDKKAASRLPARA